MMRTAAMPGGVEHKKSAIAAIVLALVLVWSSGSPGPGPIL